MKYQQFCVLLVTAVLCSCTTVPNRFAQMPGVAGNGGFVVEAESNTGFNLETFYKSYSFVPNPDDNIQDAKEYFTKVAKKLSEQRGKEMKPVLKSQLRTNSSRNVIDSNYAIYVTGFVAFK